MKKFKVGDWVINLKDQKIEQIDSMYRLNQTKRKATEEFLELCCKPWQPKEGEWCWYNKKYFIKVKNIKDEQIYFSSLDGMYINDWDYLCKFEPFIGELPTFLKDNA